MFADKNRRRGERWPSWPRASVIWRSTRALALALMVGGAIPSSEAIAKTPGKTYCFLGVCHRVKSLAETQALIGKTETMQASFYDDAKVDRFNPSNITSSGEYFRASRADNAASPVLPDGTKVMVWSPTTKKAAIVRINNAGPYWGQRKIDLSRGAADKLGFSKGAVATVQVRVLPAPSAAEATYRRGRVYEPVPGYLGGFASIDEAYTGARVALGSAGAASIIVASETWDAPMLRVTVGEVVPPPEIGQYAALATQMPVAEFEVVPSTTLLAEATSRLMPSVILAAVALTPEIAPSKERLNVAIARASAKSVSQRSVSSGSVKTGKAAPPVRVAMMIQPSPRPSNQRAGALINQSAKVPPVKRQPVVFETEDEPELSWLARVLDGTY